MNIIAIDMGHCLKNADTGARGIKIEEVLTREVGTKVVNKLKVLGYKVVNCTIDNANSVGDSLMRRVNLANSVNADLFCSIHFNCGGGRGTEVFTYGGREMTEARDILNNICDLGYRNRGIKDGSGLYVIKNTNMKAMLIECAFVDSQEDMDRLDTDKMADAIVKGLVGKIPTKTTPQVPQTPVEEHKTEYDTSRPTGNNIYPIGSHSYVEDLPDRTIIHMDRGNYISINKGSVDIYWNDGKGKSGSKRLSD